MSPASFTTPYGVIPLTPQGNPRFGNYSGLALQDMYLRDPIGFGERFGNSGYGTLNSYGNPFGSFGAGLMDIGKTTMGWFKPGVHEKTGLATASPFAGVMGSVKTGLDFARGIQDFRNASLMRKEFKNQMGRAAETHQWQKDELARLNQGRDRRRHIQQYGTQGTPEDWAKRGKEMEQWRNVA